MVRIILIGILVCSGLGIQAQEISGQEALQKVYNVLTQKGDVEIKNPKFFLEQGAWEALSYLQKKDSTTINDLEEAVPDYYRFKSNNTLLLKLINPKNHNEYGTRITVGYRVDDNIIQLLDIKDLTVKDQWTILYLDDNYMALEMGELRVFFTHTPVQEL